MEREGEERRKDRGGSEKWARLILDKLMKGEGREKKKEREKAERKKKKSRENGRKGKMR